MSIFWNKICRLFSVLRRAASAQRTETRVVSFNSTTPLTTEVIQQEMAQVVAAEEEAQLRSSSRNPFFNFLSELRSRGNEEMLNNDTGGNGGGDGSSSVVVNFVGNESVSASNSSTCVLAASRLWKSMSKEAKQPYRNMAYSTRKRLRRRRRRKTHLSTRKCMRRCRGATQAVTCCSTTPQQSDESTQVSMQDEEQAAAVKNLRRRAALARCAEEVYVDPLTAELGGPSTSAASLRANGSLALVPAVSSSGRDEPDNESMADNDEHDFAAYDTDTEADFGIDDYSTDHDMDPDMDSSPTAAVAATMI